MSWDGFSSQDYSDRKLALSFGAIVLVLMLALSSVAGYLYTRLYEKEENRLSSMLVTIFADSVAKVSFSGKYHTRQFVEEIKARIPALAFISVEGIDGEILAHSQQDMNDTYLREEESASSRSLSLKNDGIVSTDRVYEGRIIKEVLLPYRSNLDGEVMGVVRIGIKMEEVYKEKQTTIFTILVLIIILTLMAISGILLLSRYFGSAHRALATQLKGILAHAPLLISITNRDGRLLARSNLHERLFGSKADGENLPRYLDGHLAPDNIHQLTAANEEIFAHGRPVARELEVLLHGQNRTWHVSKFPIAHDAHGRPNLICTFIHDISNRKLAEKSATEAKEQWERTFDAITDIVAILDQDLRIVRANVAAADMFGMAPGDMIGRYCYDVFCDATAPCTGCPELRTLQDMGNHQAVTHNPKLGKSFDVACFPLIEEGKLSGFVHVAKDITRSLMLEEKLRKSQKMEALGTLAGGIAHDFNNILTPILGYTELALARTAPDAPLLADLQQIRAAGERARDLVRQILGFSRQESQEKKPFQPHLVVKEVIKLLRSSLPTTITFETKIATDCGTILADPTQFHQIIMNLCTNAYQAMEATDGTLGIHLSLVTIVEQDHMVASSELMPGDYILLSVSDTGCGMEHRTLERIFDPFFTTKADGKGTGLGLSVVHGIVKSCHGHIEVDSEPGKGTVFRVYLPRLPSQPTPEVAVQASPLPSGQGHILVVDDEEIITILLRKLLERLGYRATAVNDSRMALSLIEAQPSFFDLLITDMTMPHLTGIELARKVLAMKADIPIILCTGFSELINKEQAHAIGIRAYLTKPISVRELALTLHQLLAKDESRVRIEMISAAEIESQSMLSRQVKQDSKQGESGQ
ncbi:MAG: response regulator [Deltaproteobacteria bacterium]|nr:response regulator [Candidatus Anaeroferrophillacea bacterium]